MKKCREIFLKNLKHYMIKNNITQKDIHTRLGVSKSIVSDWCNGKIFPRPENLDELCDMLNISIVQLFLDNTDIYSVDMQELIEVSKQLDTEYQKFIIKQANDLLKLQKK